MPYSRLEHHTDGNGVFNGLTIHGVSSLDGTGQVTVMYDDVSGPWGGNAWLSKIPNAFQDQIDERTALNDSELEFDEWGPSGNDPNREDAFWEGNELVCRSVVIDNAAWDSTLERLSITVRRASNVPGSGP